MEMEKRLHADMVTALKTGQKDRLQVIRMLLSDVKVIDMNPAKPTAEQVVAAYAKKLKKSVEEYEKIGRAGEVAQLNSEIAIVEEYLPKKVSAEETEALVDAFLVGKTFTEKQLGQATGAFMKVHGANVDAANVSRTLKARLAGK